MNRRDFIAGMVSACVAPIFLPGADRIWKVVSVPVPKPVLGYVDSFISLSRIRANRVLPVMMGQAQYDAGLPMNNFSNLEQDFGVFCSRLEPGDFVKDNQGGWFRIVDRFNAYSQEHQARAHMQVKIPYAIDNRRLNKYWILPATERELPTR